MRSRVWELTLEALGYRRVAGVDEAGRGSLAGPVVAAAVILSSDFPSRGIRDSKLLSPTQRADAYERILDGALAVGVGVVDHAEIDRINILEATRHAMVKAIAALRPCPDFLLTDAVTLPIDCSGWALLKGDQRTLSIAAGSIMAKVTRDRLMERYHHDFAAYNFGDHKGYATADHLARLRRYGPCAIHRRSFRPVLDAGVIAPMPGGALAVDG